MQIRPLEAKADLALVLQFYRDAPDYWQLAEGVAPDDAKARAFFTDGPPGCDPAQSYPLGAFIEGRLAGRAELSFGFPAPGDAYLGFMMFAPSARGAGRGRALLAHIEWLARAAGAKALYLAVLGVNPRGRAFWEREGFAATGVCAGGWIKQPA
ncbi:GNAT family N-acetyltransferase [Vannielia sp.]|uniref:GNAT family N-acetyltransferase n=1 Tax=Vannielia sp. TaxID=2813045 RepID=UPI00261464D4|nr:GNAT family N-acetyltransferase [Vannielia sp.]MDF1871057.1 GNAT family N-acetyltransferase [Vannielia sp.]